MNRNPNKLYPFRPTFDTMKAAIGKGQRQPYLGLTQGGSSSRDRGCRIAATRGEMPATYPQETNVDAQVPS